MFSVLAYYRSEWTDVSDDDQEYGIALTNDLRRLIRNCLSTGCSVPNAAKEVEIFLNLPSEADGTHPPNADESDCGFFDK